jgi:hypothetical protein
MDTITRNLLDRDLEDLIKSVRDLDVRLDCDNGGNECMMLACEFHPNSRRRTQIRKYTVVGRKHLEEFQRELETFARRWRESQ